MTGTGVVPTPALAIAPSPVNFGSVIVGGIKAQSLDIVNLSSTPVSVTTISSSDPAIDISSLSLSCSGKALAAGVHCAATIRFNPTAVKSYSGTITFGGIVATSCGGCTTTYPTQTLAVTGTGVVPTPALAIAPSPVNFGSVIVGGIKAQSLDIVNLSSTPVSVTTISSSDPAIDISSLSLSCSGKALAAGVHCAATIRFNPTAVKSYSATITLSGIAATDCGGCTTTYPTQTLAITGTGVAISPALSITPSPVNFPSLAVGQTNSIKVTLNNFSSTSVVIKSIVSSDPAVSTSLSSSCVGVTILSGGSCTAAVSFTPTAVKSYSATITLSGIAATDCGGCTTTYPTQTLAVTGTGVAISPALSITPSPVNFPSLDVGLTNSIKVTLNNFSSTSVVIKSIVSSDPAVSTSLSSSCVGVTILSGGSCTAAVSFTPTAVKSYSATITLSGIAATDCGGCTTTYPTQTLAVTGTGVAISPALSITPSPVNFPSLDVGLTNSIKVTLNNFSSTSVVIKSIVSSDPAVSTSLSSSCVGVTILSGGSCTAAVSFTPTAVKSYSATITLSGIAATDCGGCTTTYPTQTLAITGTGVAISPALSITPSPVNFPSLAVGQTNSIKVTLNNFSSTSVVIKSIVSSDPAVSTSLSSSCVGVTILSGGSCTAAVSFTPTAVKSYSATITLSGIAATDCGGCTTTYPTQTLAVTGTGVAISPALSITPSPVNFPSLDVGLTNSIKVTLNNFSSTSVVIKSIVSSDPAVSTSLSSSCVGVTILSGGSCTAAVSFTPTAVKSYSATITLSGIAATDCGGCTTTYPTQTLAITGTGVAISPAPPAFSPAGGTFASKQSVTLSDTSVGSIIHFTVDGSTPTASSAVYTLPIQVNSSETIRAIAVQGGISSAVSSASYIINPAACQIIDYSSGFTASGLSLNGGAAINETALELTDGGLFEARSAFFSAALPTTSFTTDFTFQITDPVADGLTFTIQSNNAKVVGLSGGGLGYAGIPSSVAIKVDLHNNAGEGTDSTGTYIDGAYPSTPAIDLAPAGIDLHSGHIFAGHLAYASGLTMGTIKDTVTGVSASMNFPGDITTIVGNNAWFGFTAGTGGKSATQKILTWSYSGGAGCPVK